MGRVARSIKEEKCGEGAGGVDFKGERDRGVAIVKRIGPAREAERASEQVSK